MTIDNFMNNVLNGKIEEIFADINAYIFEQENVDMDHVYIDGTKITANANKYSWVWKKSCEKNRVKVFAKITELLSEINKRIAAFGVKFGVREEYAIEYLEQILKQYIQLCGFDPASAVRGRGHHKTPEQRYYDKLTSYIARLKKYAEHIKICGNERNSYSKTDHDATFMRMKKDYMGNDQLLPGYNIQFGVCDEYIAVYDVKQYASDMDCFKPLMEKFHRIYGKYPEYPVTDAGYGSFFVAAFHFSSNPKCRKGSHQTPDSESGPWESHPRRVLRRFRRKVSLYPKPVVAVSVAARYFRMVSGSLSTFCPADTVSGRWVLAYLHLAVGSRNVSDECI